MARTTTFVGVHSDADHLDQRQARVATTEEACIRRLGNLKMAKFKMFPDGHLEIMYGARTAPERTGARNARAN
jgi:hypothetical protein